MANYTCATRTNYFHVQDPEQFKLFMARVYGTENHVELWEEPDADGNPTYAFGTKGSIGGLRSSDPDTAAFEHNDVDHAAFIHGLQRLITDDDAVIIQESGREKLCYLVGSALIITKNQCEHLDILDVAVAKARQMLGNPEWGTRTDY